MALKVPLRIVLHAGDLVIAESDDGALWRRALRAITEARRTPLDADVPAPDDLPCDGAFEPPAPGSADAAPAPASAAEDDRAPGAAPHDAAVDRSPPGSADATLDRAPGSTPGDDAVDRFAIVLGVSKDAIVRACAPSLDSPYLRLDRHAWEEMRRGTPPRGPGSVSRAAVVAALLALWFRSARLGSPTMKMVHRVLRTIGLRDKNATRIARDAEWMQLRSGTVVLNLARASGAVALARAFCACDWTGYRAR